ncbi:unnamed protein product, partial [Adineta steineri]
FNARSISLQQDYQRQINDKDEQIRQLTKQLNDLRNNNSKGNGHYQSHLQIDVLKSTQIQLDQAQDQNHRLHNEIKLLQNELTNKVQLINHYEKQISLLEKQINSRGSGTTGISIQTNDLSELLEEMRRLRQDLER